MRILKNEKQKFWNSLESICWFIGFLCTAIFFLASLIVDFIHPDRQIKFDINVIVSLSEISFAMIIVSLMDLFSRDKIDLKCHKVLVFLKIIGCITSQIILIMFVAFYIIQKTDHMIFFQIGSVILLLASYCFGYSVKKKLKKEGA